MNNEYVFFFVGGSCGSFVKVIFHYYLNKVKNIPNNIPFETDPNTGHCHDNQIGTHFHYINRINLAKKVVLIDFDDDDQPCIIKMAFNKVVKKQLAYNPNFLKTRWPAKFSNVDSNNLTEVEQVFLDNPTLLIFDDWRDQVKTLQPVLTIKFKDIMFGNLNLIISNFFQVEPAAEVEDFIAKYRSLNQKYTK